MAEIIEVTDCGGEPVAYYVEGHAIDLRTFARDVDARAAPDDVTEEEIAKEARREWWLSVRCDCGDHGEHFIAGPPRPPSLPVTVWHVSGDGWRDVPPEAPAAPAPGTPADEKPRMRGGGPGWECHKVVRVDGVEVGRCRRPDCHDGPCEAGAAPGTPAERLAHAVELHLSDSPEGPPLGVALAEYRRTGGSHGSPDVGGGSGPAVRTVPEPTPDHGGRGGPSERAATGPVPVLSAGSGGADGRSALETEGRAGHGRVGAAPGTPAPAYDMSIHSNPDARAWARFFEETRRQNGWPSIPDEETMIGWFANAMMAQHDYDAMRAPPDTTPRPPDEVRAERWYAFKAQALRRNAESGCVHFSADVFGTVLAGAFDAGMAAEREAALSEVRSSRAGAERGTTDLERLASGWESKAIWLRHECPDGVGAQARANVYNECADAVRALARGGSK